MATGLAVLIQWLIYDDWLHDRGPLRIVGSFLAGTVTFAFSYRLQEFSYRRRLEAERRLESMRRAQDRVRNSLQTIECVTYAQDPDSAEPIRTAVDLIERTLHEAILGESTELPPKVVNTMRENDPGTSDTQMKA